MQQWHPSRPLPEKALDDLYYFIEQSDKKTAPLSAKTPDHTYNWYLLLTGDPEPLEIQAPVLTDKRKKNIIVSNYILAADPEGGKESITLLLELAQRGFSLYVFTQADQLEHINPKIRDIPYLKSLFARSHLLHTKAMRAKLAQSKHPKNPISFSDESCFILDHYQTEKIKHAWQDEEGSPFDYQVKVHAATLLDSNPLRDHVQWDKSHLILVELNRETMLSTSFNDLFPGVKKITLDSPLAFPKFLPEDLEELCIDTYVGDIDLSRFKKLQHLTVIDFAGKLEGDPPSQLQTVKIKGDFHVINFAQVFPCYYLHDCLQLKKIEIIDCENLNIIDSLLHPILYSERSSPLELRFTGENYQRLEANFRGGVFSLTKLKLKTSYGEGFPFLDHTKITDLDICNTKPVNTISNENIRKIRLSRALKKARFEQVITIPPLFDTLEDLTIKECRLRKISLLFPRLKRASLMGNKEVTLIDVSNANARQLEYLEILGSPKANIQGLTALSRLHTLIIDVEQVLESLILDLDGLNPLTKLPSLKHLRLSGFTFYQDWRAVDNDMNPDDFSNLPLESFALVYYNQTSHLPIILPKTLTYLRLEHTTITSLDLRAYPQLRYVYLEDNAELTSVQLPAGVISFINNENPRIDIQAPDKFLPALKKDDSHIHKKRESYDKKQQKQISENLRSKPFTSSDFKERGRHFDADEVETDFKKTSTIRASHTDDCIPTTHSLAEDTYTDSQNESVEVRYKIYGMVDGCQTELPANTYRKEVCDGIGWNERGGLTVSSTSTFQGLTQVSCPLKEYTTEDLNWLKSDERFVQRPLEVKSRGTHRISLDTLKPYDELIDIALPPESRLLFNKNLNSYVLEWKTKGPQKATVQYRFREAPRPDIKHPSDLKRRRAPTLDKNLRKHLETLFLTETNPNKPPQAFVTLKEELSKVFKGNAAEKLTFCRNELADYCQKFGNAHLTEKKGWKKLEEILVDAKGACHDRSMVFVMLCHFLGIEARYIGNDIHAFVELRNAQGIWESLQLGGHEAQLKYTDQPLNLPKPVKDEKHSPSANPEPGSTSGLLRSARNDEGGGRNDEKGRISWKPYFASERKEKKYENLSAVLDDLHSTANPLVTVADATAAQQLYVAMAHHLAENKYKKPVLYIESPSDLHAFWKVCHIPESEDDTEEAENAPLREIVEKGGTVMINWERFNATEMDSYKTLMDDPPSFKAVTIAADVRKDVRFIHMITPKTQGSGAFLSRTNKFKWPAQHAIPTLSSVIPASPVIPARMPGPRPQEAKLSHPCELDPGILAGTTKGGGGTTHRIDLYGSSSHWETQLVGTILPSNQGFTFNSGTLTEIAKAPSSEPVHIELVDTPKDHRFQAFMTRLSVNHGFIANGRSRALPKQFTVSDAPAPEIKTPTQLNSIPASTWNADGEPKELPQNVFVLNSSRLPHLFQEQALRETDQEGVFDISTEAGWLPAYKTPSPCPLPPLRGGEGVDSREQEEKSSHQIIQTAPISEGEKRRILHAIGEQDKTIEWVDLSGLPAAEMKPLGSTSNIPNKNILIQTLDPEFMAQELVGDAKDKDNIVSIPIYATTTSSELLESIDLLTPNEDGDEKEQKSHVKKPPQFSCKTQPMLQALREGKTVILHGQLSAQVYESLQTLFLPNPYLTLSTFPYTQPMKGRLIVLSDTMPQATVLAQRTGSQTYLPQEMLWKGYEARLNSPSRHPVRDDGMMGRLKSLYALATQYSPEQPPFISYNVLCQCLEALEKDTSEDNPIKPWFQNEEQGSTNYAQLNVLAKLFLGPNTPPTVRTEKLKRYSPHEEDDVWHRLNCLNPSALRQVITDKEHPMDNKTLLSKLNSWLKDGEYKPRTSNPDPHAKVMKRMRKHLREKNAVVLKGPPGSGKSGRRISMQKKWVALHF